MSDQPENHPRPTTRQRLRGTGPRRPSGPLVPIVVVLVVVALAYFLAWPFIID